MRKSIIRTFLLGIIIISAGCLNGKAVFANTKSEMDVIEKPAIDSIMSHQFNYNYDYMKDTKFMTALKKLGKYLLKPESADFKGDYGTHYAIGDVDGDKIPELVVYEQKSIDNVDDPGYLAVYSFSFTDGDYKLYCRTSMNFDNTCKGLAVGKISKTKSAIFVNDLQGLHSGITYLYVIDEGKLKNVLDQRYIDRLSAFPKSQFKDIDNDGINEFSICAIDPESPNQSMVGSDKITYWYKWNGKSGGTLVKVARSKKVVVSKTAQTILNNFGKMLKSQNDTSKLLTYVSQNMTKLSKQQISQCIDAIMQIKSKQGEYIDYQLIIDGYGKFITNELNQYCRIMSLEELRPIQIYGVIVTLSWDDIAKRISAIDIFKKMFPYTKYSYEVDKLRKNYLNYYLYGTADSPIYDSKTMMLLPDVKASYEKSLNVYIYEPFYYEVKNNYDKLKKNQFKITPNSLKKINPPPDAYYRVNSISTIGSGYVVKKGSD